MMQHARLNFHPLRMTTTIARDGLVRFLAATGHPPRVELVSRTGAQATGTIAIGSTDTI